jgi:hypothetical protein
VIRFLSPEWVDAFNRAVQDVELPPPGPAAGLATRDGAFTMGQVVTGGPEGEVRTTLRVQAGRLSMTWGDEAGSGTDPDVTVRLAWDDAVAMAAGELAPDEAIAAGRVRVRGDLSVLAEARGVLVGVQPVLGGLRDRTEY